MSEAPNRREGKTVARRSITSSESAVDAGTVEKTGSAAARSNVTSPQDMAATTAGRRIFRILDTEHAGVLSPQQISREFERRGLLRDDPRLSKFFSTLDRFEDGRITPERLEACVETSSVLIERALSGQLIIPRFSDFTDELAQIFEQVRHVKDGNVAKYIPQLAGVSPDKFGVSVCTIDGQRFAVGDTRETFSVQSTSKPVTYCLALEEHGEAKVHSHVGREPSGVSFNALTLNSMKRPHNPMINSGAIMSCALVRPELSAADRFDYVLDRWARLCGGARPIFNNSVYLSEKATADRNFALAYFMRESGAFPEGIDLSDILDFYFQCCSIELTADQFAVGAATLANGGVCPTTGERVFNNLAVKNCLSLMASCGMYDYSGEFAFSIGLPAKSGVGGGLIVVVPNVLGLCVWSPPLDHLGNSVRGLEVCRRLNERYNFHNFDCLIEGQSTKTDPRRRANESRLEGVMSLCWAASQGDLVEVQQLLARNVNVNDGDYDGRTALHLAASEGHLPVVRFLVQQGARLDAKDRWGGTPLEDATREKRHAVIEFLKNSQSSQAKTALM